MPVTRRWLSDVRFLVTIERMNRAIPDGQEGPMKVIAIILVFVATAAYGEIYTWTDARGAANYANRLDDIPVRYRAKARSLKYGADPQEGASVPLRTDNVLPATDGQLTRTPGDFPAVRANRSGSVNSRQDEVQQQMKVKRENRKEREHRSPGRRD